MAKKTGLDDPMVVWSLMGGFVVFVIIGFFILQATVGPLPSENGKDYNTWDPAYKQSYGRFREEGLSQDEAAEAAQAISRFNQAEQQRQRQYQREIDGLR